MNVKQKLQLLFTKEESKSTHAKVRVKTNSLSWLTFSYQDSFAFVDCLTPLLLQYEFHSRCYYRYLVALRLLNAAGNVTCYTNLEIRNLQTVFALEFENRDPSFRNLWDLVPLVVPVYRFFVQNFLCFPDDVQPLATRILLEGCHTSGILELKSAFAKTLLVVLVFKSLVSSSWKSIMDKTNSLQELI